VDDAVVLQVAARAEHDLVEVAAQHGAVEDARTRPDADPADHGRRGREPGRGVDVGRVAVEGEHRRHGPDPTAASQVTRLHRADNACLPRVTRRPRAPLSM
jgi:hypothetical protein